MLRPQPIRLESKLTVHKTMDLKQLADAIVRIPKVELHVHLEGATDAETVWEMARRNRVGLPAATLDEWKRHYQFKNFEHFIEVYTTAASTMCTPADWAFMIDRFMANQARQNIVYSEVYVSASHQIGKLPLNEWMYALAEGASIAEKQHGVQIRFLVDISRHMPETQSTVLDCAILGKKTGHVIGLGLGGIETGYPPSLFVETYREAERQGLRLVAHAGETTGPETILDSIDLLQAQRIGHGVRCLDDPQLVSRLRESQIPLEVCPTSNYCLGVVKPGEPHPIRRMVNEGIFCTINSDDPPMFATSLVEEYGLLFRQGFSWDELVQLNANAVEASFLPNDHKALLRQQLSDQDRLADENGFN